MEALCGLEASLATSCCTHKTTSAKELPSLSTLKRCGGRSFDPSSFAFFWFFFLLIFESLLSTRKQVFFAKERAMTFMDLIKEQQRERIWMQILYEQLCTAFHWIGFLFPHEFVLQDEVSSVREAARKCKPGKFGKTHNYHEQHAPETRSDWNDWNMRILCW